MISKKIFFILLSICILFDSSAYCKIPRFTASESKLYTDAIAYQWYYGNDGLNSMKKNILELKNMGSKDINRFEDVMLYWNTLDNAKINIGVAPDGFSDEVLKKTVIVVLGYGLASDGSMRTELVKRLQVARSSYLNYKKLPYILVTGGNTGGSATEGGRMADWLKKNGVEENKIIKETRAGSTIENARLSLKILYEKYKTLTNIILVTSDYHIKRGIMCFYTYYTYHKDSYPGYEMKIISNAGPNIKGTSITSSEQKLKAISVGSISGHKISGSYPKPKLTS